MTDTPPAAETALLAFLDEIGVAYELHRHVPLFTVEDSKEATAHLPGKGRLPDLRFKAYQAGEEVGECYSISARAFADREVLDECIFTMWLGINEPFQGRGLGHYLLSHSLVEARRLGYRHAAISTALTNHRALLFYSNFGYRAVDWTRQFRREWTLA